MREAIRFGIIGGGIFYLNSTGKIKLEKLKGVKLTELNVKKMPQAGKPDEQQHKHGRSEGQPLPDEDRRG